MADKKPEHLFNNKMREFVGLNPLSEHLEAVQLEQYMLYFEGDIIRKIIHYADFDTVYGQVDTEVITQNREWILPTSKRGKTHPLNIIQLSKIKHRGISMQIEKKIEGQEAGIDLQNWYNNLGVKIPFPGDLKGLEGVAGYFPKLVKSAPEHWQQMIRQ